MCCDRGAAGAASVNKSLKTFKDVIVAVAAGKKSRAPYNEAPLTHILKACTVWHCVSLFSYRTTRIAGIVCYYIQSNSIVHKVLIWRGFLL